MNQATFNLVKSSELASGFITEINTSLHFSNQQSINLDSPQPVLQNTTPLLFVIIPSSSSKASVYSQSILWWISDLLARQPQLCKDRSLLAFLISWNMWAQEAWLTSWQLRGQIGYISSLSMKCRFPKHILQSSATAQIPSKGPPCPLCPPQAKETACPPLLP